MAQDGKFNSKALGRHLILDTLMVGKSSDPQAAACITSDSTVQRDPLYDGRVIDERCTVVSRIAPNFFRIGSFEIFKSSPPGSGERS
eukprot:gene6622-8793_t